MLAIPAKASDDKCDWEKVLQKHLSRNYSPALVRESVALPFSFFFSLTSLLVYSLAAG